MSSVKAGLTAEPTAAVRGGPGEAGRSHIAAAARLNGELIMCKAIMIVSVMLGTLLLGSTQTAANPMPPPGDITPYADVEGTSQVIETPEGVVHIYIIWKSPWSGSASALACQFSAPKPSCFNAEYLGEIPYFTDTVGNTQTGMAIAFGACLNAPAVLVSLSYMAVGSTVCCEYPVLPHPDATSGEIEFADCNQDKVLGTGGALFLKCTTPVEPSTWGKVKSLYAQ